MSKLGDRDKGMIVVEFPTCYLFFIAHWVICPIIHVKDHPVSCGSQPNAKVEYRYINICIPYTNKPKFFT